MNLPTIAKHFGVFPGEDFIVVGTGPSLCGFNWPCLKWHWTIALNDAVRFFEPTYHLFSDVDIWPRYKDLAYAPETHVVCQNEPAAYLSSHPNFSAKERLLTFTQRGPDVDPINDELWCNYTVATAGVQLAWKLGAHTVYLLGVDAYRYHTVDHCHEAEREPVELPIVVEPWDAFFNTDMEKVRAYFDSFQLGPPGGVYNLSARSTIRAWPKKKMEEVL
jgi:hypothetical protein